MTTARTLLSVLLLAIGGLSAPAQGVLPAVRPPVDHPACSPPPARTPATWRAGVERFGERLAAESLARRGYAVADRKLAGNRGIDLVAVKRDAGGRLAEVRLVEVKAHAGSAPRLGRTAAGRQMSSAWLQERLRSLPDRPLAREIARYRRESGVPLTALGEVHDVNFRRGTYTVRDTRLAPLARPVPLGTALGDITADSTSAASRRWADRHLTGLHIIRQTRMTGWLGAGSTSRAVTRVAATRTPLNWAGAATRVGRLVRVAGRAVGPVGDAVAAAADVGLDAYAWQTGTLSEREFVTRTAGNAGGLAGAWAGAWVGAQLGAFGGPAAWLTVPAGIVIGGTVGYLAGSELGRAVAGECYRQMDEQTRRDTAARLRDISFPLTR